jgi:hypothetical protein
VPLGRKAPLDRKVPRDHKAPPDCRAPPVQPDLLEPKAIKVTKGIKATLVLKVFKDQQEVAEDLLFLVELTIAKRALYASESTGMPFRQAHEVAGLEPMLFVAFDAEERPEVLMDRIASAPFTPSRKFALLRSSAFSWAKTGVAMNAAAHR